MPIGWTLSIIALWMVVLMETILLLRLLSVLGKLKQGDGALQQRDTPSPDLGGPAIGEQIIAFEAKDQHGTLFRSSELSGRKSILAFIFPGCKACEETISALNNLVEQQPAIAVVVIGGIDRHKNNAYADQYQALFPVLTPNSMHVVEQYRIRSFPFALAIDEEGIIYASKIVNRRKDVDMLLDAAFGSAVAP